MNKISLFDEYRLIERSENEVNIAWKGAHLLLFFLAFVFGSFCTFCFHMLMYLFDEKCVLFPKLLSLTSPRHNVIYEFLPGDMEKADMLPVDFLSTQWVEKSACYLPTFVPLVSGIFGLIWTSMFLMCSTGSRTLTGLQRPWRVILPVLIFSVAMGSLCIYSSTVTHHGLHQLCVKLGEVTGSSTCSYTVNVATLVYERRIRGVYQATRLTILSAWLHTSCWILSALLALVRILLAVDFQLVRINVELLGNSDKILERHEEHLRTVFPDPGFRFKSTSDFSIFSPESSTEVRFHNEIFDNTRDSIANDFTELSRQSDILYFADELPSHTSELSLVPEERYKLARLEAYQSVPKDRQFIVRLLYDFYDNIEFPEVPKDSPVYLSSSSMRGDATMIARQFGQESISSKSPVFGSTEEFESVNLEEAEAVVKEIKRHLQENLKNELPIDHSEPASPSTSKKRGHIAFESSMNISLEMKRTLEDKLNVVLQDVDRDKEPIKKKSNLKTIGIQTNNNKDNLSNKKQKVTISESKSTYFDSGSSSSVSLMSADDEDTHKDNETQTPPKEKQD